METPKKVFTVIVEETNTSFVAVEAQSEEQARAVVERSIAEGVSVLNFVSDLSSGGFEVKSVEERDLEDFGIKQNEVHTPGFSMGQYCPVCLVIEDVCEKDKCAHIERND